MRQTRTRRSQRGRLSAALRASILCVALAGCAHGGVAVKRCSEPTDAEIDDYESIVLADPERPAVRFVGRLIAGCWPEEAEEARQDG